jgi:hypothetical protein
MIVGVVFGIHSAVAAPLVEVMSVGSGEKQPLRIESSTGYTQGMNVVWDMSMTTNMGGMDVPMNFPSVNMDFDVATTDETSPSNVHYTLNLSNLFFESSEEDIANPMVATMEQEMKQMVGMTTKVVMKRDGQTVSTKTLGSGPSAPEMVSELTKALGQSLVIFPKEPVGVGATWLVTEKMEERGVQMTRKTLVELKERKGEQIQLGLTITGTPDSMSVTSPDLPPGSTAKIKSFEMKGSGTVQYDLKKLYPLDSKVKVYANTLMEVSAAGQVMEMGTGVEINVQVRSD